MFAGFLRGEAVEVASRASAWTSRCRPTPRSCSRATSSAAESAEEGPFGDHTGFYTPAEPFPRLPPDRDDDAPERDLPIDRRRQAAAGGRLAGQGDRADLPAADQGDRARDRRLRPAASPGVFHNCAIVSIRKAYPAHARKVMHAIWGLGLLSLTRCVIVVDHDVDSARLRPGCLLRRRERRSGPRPRPRSTGRSTTSTTRRPSVRRRQARHRRDRASGPVEGPARPWPDEIEMTPEIRRRVDERWDELGITLPGG